LANTSTGNRVETNNCLESINQALGIARNHPEIKTVYLAARWAYYTTGQGYGLDNTPSKEIYVNDRRGTPAIMEIKRGLVETLAMLRANGKRVVFVHDAPELSFDPAECSPANEIFTVRRLKDPCGVPLAEYRNRQSSYRAWAEQVLRENQDVGVIDPESTMCTEGFCFAKRGSDVLYSDSHHLNTAGSRYLMQRVEQP